MSMMLIMTYNGGVLLTMIAFMAVAYFFFGSEDVDGDNPINCCSGSMWFWSILWSLYFYFWLHITNTLTKMKINWLKILIDMIWSIIRNETYKFKHKIIKQSNNQWYPTDNSGPATSESRHQYVRCFKNDVHNWRCNWICSDQYLRYNR